MYFWLLPMSRIYGSIRAAKKFAFKLSILEDEYVFRKANKNNWSNAIKMSVRINRCTLIKYFFDILKISFIMVSPS